MTTTIAMQLKSKLANSAVILTKEPHDHALDRNKKRPKEDSFFKVCGNPAETMTVLSS